MAQPQPYYVPRLGKLLLLPYLSFLICNVKMNMALTSQCYWELNELMHMKPLELDLAQSRYEVILFIDYLQSVPAFVESSSSQRSYAIAMTLRLRVLTRTLGLREAQL